MTSNQRSVYASLLRLAQEQHLLTLAVAGTGRPGLSGDFADPYVAVESEIEELIAQQEAEELTAIQRALRVLARAPEKYGRCEVCHEEIATQRLNVTPWTTRCDAHDLEHSFRD